jgi:hypothetical protein
VHKFDNNNVTFALETDNVNNASTFLNTLPQNMQRNDLIAGSSVFVRNS